MYGVLFARQLSDKHWRISTKSFDDERGALEFAIGVEPSMQGSQMCPEVSMYDGHGWRTIAHVRGGQVERVNYTGAKV